MAADIEKRLAEVLAAPKQHHQGSPMSYMSPWAASRMAEDLMPIIREAKAEALREAADEFERLAALGSIPSGQITDEQRAEFWAFAEVEKPGWIRARANGLAQ